MNDKLFSVLLAICLGLASFSLKFAFDANAEIQSMKGTNELQFQQIKDSLGDIANDKENDIRQDKVLNKLWKTASWSKTEINKLQFKAGEEPTSWPDLGE
jgi:hypothetical protein